MKRSCAFGLGLLLGVVLASGDARAYSVVLDMDASLPGIQASVSVTPGATITVTGHLTSVSGGALFDHVGFDLNWSKPTDTAFLTPAIGSPAAGSLAGVVGSVTDFFGGGAITPGSTLTTSTLAPVGANTLSLGGFGYMDATATFFASLGSPFGPPGTTIDVFTADFVVTGAVGSSATLDPSGIYAPGLWPPPPPVASGGDALYDGIVTLFTFPGTFTGGVVTLVPEPAPTVLLAIALVVLALRRRR